MNDALAMLCAVLREPEQARHLSPAQWDACLRLADAGKLTSSLAAYLAEAGLISALPDALQQRLAAAQVVGLANRRAAHWEVKLLQRCFGSLDLPVVLLKGAAYSLGQLPAATGRLFGDIDILVPQARLADAEAALFWQGWVNSHHDAYDDHYYRAWMHELPPLMHQKRQTVLDVHHTILPPTARYHPDPARLQADAQTLAGYPHIRILSPCDMVLHSACHLFHESEWDSGLRDLFDLDRLLRHFGQDPEFYAALAARAVLMELQRPLFYALRYASMVWKTPVPASCLAAIHGAAPSPGLLQLMDWLILRAIRPVHPLVCRRADRLARFLLYVRGHWLRMPAHLLVPHLLRKAIKPYLRQAETPQGALG